MQLGDIKPLFSSLVLPPAGPLLLALVGLLWARRRRGPGLALAAFGIVLNLVLSIQAVGVGLSHVLLPQVPPARLSDVQGVQAIVVLGGGVDPVAPEYGQPQLNEFALERLRYGVWLVHRTGKPLAYAGGAGWGGPQEAEAKVAEAVLKDDYGITLRWREERSRDTRENADFLAQMVQPQGVHRIALVTDAWHMPRALHYFRAAGFDVVPAPTRYIELHGSISDWLPSIDGVLSSYRVLHEWVGLKVAHIR